MQIRVLFFGVLKDLVGRSSDELTFPDHAKVRDVVEHYAGRIASLNGMLGSIAISVNQEYSGLEARLNPGDEIALLPPVSGGSPAARITRDVIDSAAVLAEIKRAEDGAAAVFEGIVRNHSRGRRTLFLEYEAYEHMALKQMGALAQQAISQFQIRDVAMVHRLGHLKIGETSVLIIVASAHRAAAFDACRWLIDTLKRTVPIWKKEYFEDGSVWADGEPFPAELSVGAGTHSRSSASK
jgi:molybdopterin synthase catalytic subunit